MIDMFKAHKSFFYPFKPPAEYEIIEDAEHDCFAIKCRIKTNGKEKEMIIDFELLVSPDMDGLKKLAAGPEKHGQPAFYYRVRRQQNNRADPFGAVALCA